MLAALELRLEDLLLIVVQARPRSLALEPMGIRSRTVADRAILVCIRKASEIPVHIAWEHHEDAK